MHLQRFKIENTYDLEFFHLNEFKDYMLMIAFILIIAESTFILTIYIEIYRLKHIWKVEFFFATNLFRGVAHQVSIRCHSSAVARKT